MKLTIEIPDTLDLDAICHTMSEIEDAATMNADDHDGCVHAEHVSEASGLVHRLRDAAKQ
jgi:hypothetical protein